MHPLQWDNKQGLNMPGHCVAATVATVGEDQYAPPLRNSITNTDVLAIPPYSSYSWYGASVLLPSELHLKPANNRPVFLHANPTLIKRNICIVHV